jgi:hypothetical protein
MYVYMFIYGSGMGGSVVHCSVTQSLSQFGRGSGSGMVLAGDQVGVWWG